MFKVGDEVAVTGAFFLDNVQKMGIPGKVVAIDVCDDLNYTQYRVEVVLYAYAKELDLRIASEGAFADD